MVYICNVLPHYFQYPDSKRNQFPERFTLIAFIVEALVGIGVAKLWFRL